MKKLMAITFTFALLGGSAFASVDSAKKEANERLDRSTQELQKVRTCVTKATSEAAIRSCRVDIFPVSSDAQKMEDKKDEKKD